MKKNENIDKQERRKNHTPTKITLTHAKIIINIENCRN